MSQHKRLKEAPTTKLSGLIKDWETKGVSRHTGKHRGSPQIRSAPATGIPSKAVSGGLTDEDLVSQRPFSKESNGRDVTRKNEASTVVNFRSN